MCGIAGLFSINEPLESKWIEKMTVQIAHRGPDAQGLFTSENKLCSLGHRRLSILDLSEAANQPMHSACGAYTIVFNGEVYNFEVLKKELIQEFDVSFRTTSDTEVLLEAFIHWGESFVEKLNGMFAIAIYYSKTNQLFLFRDRLGIKPIFYYWKDGVFAFASELKSITALHELTGKFTLNHQALHYYLRLGYIPAPHTVYKEISKFPAATQARVDESGVVFHNYWSLESQLNKKTITDENKAKIQLHELLRESIRKRLKSDVPFGVFLSGGIDSSTVAAIAQQIHDQPIQTFSIAFNEAKYNEAEYAKSVANHIGSDHNEYTVSYKDAQDLIPELSKMYDEPFADASAIPTLLVSQLARKKVKMVLTGDGGDEQFLGYGMYQWAQRLQQPLFRALRLPLTLALKNAPNPRLKRISEVLDYTSLQTLKSHIFSSEQYFFTEKDIPSLFPSSNILPLQFETKNKLRDLSAREEQALFDLNYYLKDDLLVKVDRASMKASLEARVPLLDHEIVSFSLNLDESLKVKGKETKYLLKEVLYEYVPRQLFDRPKWGFGLPIRYWLSNELKWMLEELITEENLNALQLNAPFVIKIKKRFLAGEDQLFNKLWLIMMLVQWYETHKKFLNEY